MAPRKAPVTSSRTRQERIKNRGKAPASTPKPRRTAAGNRGAQKGPLKPGTRTSGTPMVNSRSATMRRIQAKASAARSRAQGQPGIKGPIKLPNSQRAGVNLPKVGAGVVKPPAGQMSPAKSAALKAQGNAAKTAAQTRRANAATNEARRSAINLKQSTKNLQGLKAAASTLGGARSLAYQAIAESIAPRPTSMLAGLKAGKAAAAATAKAKAKSADSFGGQYQKGGPSKKAAPKMSKAKSFDNAFASARNSGMKTFVWEGKTYTTKMK
jgi:hypothetical protein